MSVRDAPPFAEALPVRDRPSSAALRVADVTDPAEWVVRRFQEGDDAAFEQLYRLTRERVYRVLYKMVGPRPELEDLVQETYLQLHKSLRRFRGDSRFTTFAHRVAANVALKYLRSRRRNPEAPWAEGSDQPTDAPDPERAAQSRQAERIVQLALEQLSPKKRIVFTCVELLGMSLDEVAEAVEIPLNTVRSRLLAARTEFPDAVARVTRAPLDGGSR